MCRMARLNKIFDSCQENPEKNKTALFKEAVNFVTNFVLKCSFISTHDNKSRTFKIKVTLMNIEVLTLISIKS